MSAVFPRTYLMGDVADVATADGLVVTGEFFRTLGVSARLGRTFSDMDEAGAAVAVLSHGLWERRFGASETVIGTSVTLNDKPHEVVGVMPRDFELRMLDQSAYARNTADFDVLVALPQADNTRTVRLTLVVVAGAVGCLLLIACMNIATLWLGRSSGRAREAAIRVALGSGRMRLVRQFLAESLLMTCIGGACGLGLAALAVHSDRRPMRSAAVSGSRTAPGGTSQALWATRARRSSTRWNG